MNPKWKERKFWLAIIAGILNIIAIFGYDVSVLKLVLPDAIVAVWIASEAVVDAAKANASNQK